MLTLSRIGIQLLRSTVRRDGAIFLETESSGYSYIAKQHLLHNSDLCLFAIATK